MDELTTRSRTRPSGQTVENSTLEMNVSPTRFKRPGRDNLMQKTRSKVDHCMTFLQA